ncbi:MAG: MBL fold metallo-hydrolase [Phycisphaerales bacterium]
MAPAPLLALVLAVLTASGCASPASGPPADPFVIVLGVAQDGGVPQLGSTDHAGWTDARARRLVASLGLADPRTGERWVFDATPDFPEQVRALGREMRRAQPLLSGVFLTHAHIGHYTGLMYLGHESLGAREMPVYTMPRMRAFLESNGPWDQLVRYGNIDLRPLAAGEAVMLAEDLRVTPLLVPHRQEYSEVVAYRIEGPGRAALYLPDIDSWREWDDMGVRLEDVLATVDIAFLDATFFADGEIPGRDMSGFPHPFVRTTIDRLAPLPASERAKVVFIHLNHTNPALRPDSDAHDQVRRAGHAVAERGMVFSLGGPPVR